MELHFTFNVTTFSSQPHVWVYIFFSIVTVDFPTFNVHNVISDRH